MPLTPEQIQQMRNQATAALTKVSSSGGQKAVKPGDGANRYRILPNWVDKSPLNADVYRLYAQHFVRSPAKNAEGSSLAAVTLCQRSTYRDKCPVCDAYFNNYQRTDIPPEAQALIKQANGGTKWLVNALHINGGEPTKPIVLELPFRVGESLFGNSKTGASGMMVQYLSMSQCSMLDLNEGSDIVIRRSGMGRNTSYSVEWPAEASHPVPASVLDHLTDLDEYIKAWQHTPEEEAKAVAAIEAIANGGTAQNVALSMGSAPSAASSPAFAQPQAPMPQAQPQMPTQSTPPWMAQPQAAPQPQPQMPQVAPQPQMPQASAQPPQAMLNNPPFDPDSDIPETPQHQQMLQQPVPSNDIDAVLAGLGG